MKRLIDVLQKCFIVYGVPQISSTVFPTTELHTSKSTVTLRLSEDRVYTSLQLYGSRFAFFLDHPILPIKTE